MKCCRLLRYDLKNGLARNWLFLFAPFCVFILCNQCRQLLAACGTSGTWAVYVAYCFRGTQTISRTSLSGGFVLPVFWMLVLVLPLLITLNFPFRDMKTVGPQLLLHSGSRTRWWLSKCAWNFCCTAAYFLLLYATAAAYCLATGVPLSMETAVGPVMALFGEAEVLPLEAEGMALGQRCFVLLVLPFAAVTAMDMLEMLFSLLIRPAYSFLVCVAMLAAASYVTSPLLIGNYANLTRSGAFINDGLDGQAGLVICASVLILSIAAGVFCFRKRDILPDYKEL